MATTIQLNGAARTASGKGSARKLRRDRRIPGVLYGRGVEPLLVTLDEREFVRSVGGHAVSNLIVDLKMDGNGDLVKTLIREVQLDPVSGAVLHVDLNRISLTEAIEVEIPVELNGMPLGVKNSGGILQHPVRALAIKCLPQDMPDKITLDVSALEIGDAIRVADLDLPNVTILDDPDTTLASVIPPSKLEEPAPGEAAPQVVEPELVGKKKEAEAEEAPAKGGKEKEGGKG
jgi:large subunit ribosomal protein L25